MGKFEGKAEKELGGRRGVKEAQRSKELESAGSGGTGAYGQVSWM